MRTRIVLAYIAACTAAASSIFVSTNAEPAPVSLTRHASQLSSWGPVAIASHPVRLWWLKSPVTPPAVVIQAAPASVVPPTPVPPPNPVTPPVPTVAPVAVVQAALPVSDATSTATADWACIRDHESSDNYAIVDSPYSGAYQFLDSTWADYDGFAIAADAPPAVQDEAALQLYDRDGWEPWSTRFVCGL